MDYYSRGTVALNFHDISYTSSVNVYIQNDPVNYLAFGHQYQDNTISN